MGIRAEESTKRSKRKMVHFNNRNNQIWYSPLLNWKEWEIWEYIEENNLQYPIIYDQGFSRVGCVICPFHRFKEIEKYKHQWPKFYKAFEIAMKKLWDTKSGRIDNKPWPESTFEEFLSNWYKGK